MPSTKNHTRNESPESPATAVAILVAARHSGDRNLERMARRRLANDFGIKITFSRKLGGAE